MNPVELAELRKQADHPETCFCGCKRLGSLLRAYDEAVGGSSTINYAFSFQGWIVVQRRRDGRFDPAKALAVNDSHDASVWWTRAEAESAMDAMVTSDIRSHFMVAPVLIQALDTGSQGL